MTWIQSVNAVAISAIAMLAAVIAFGQWRTARQKLALDLFDRRFQVFIDVRRIASEALQRGKLTEPGLPNEVLARGRFLFGPEVQSELETLHALCVDLEVGNAGAGFKINQHFNQMHALFEPYMRMHQKLPQRF